MTKGKAQVFLAVYAFGRTTIRPPDGASHDVTTSYTGDRVVQRTVKIATSRTAEESVTRMSLRSWRAVDRVATSFASAAPWCILFHQA